MKRRRPERVDRRRTLIELNLISETKPPRLAIRRRGCFATSAIFLLALSGLVASTLGLH
jgi:hypothetical protein